MGLSQLWWYVLYMYISILTIYDTEGIFAIKISSSVIEVVECLVTSNLLMSFKPSKHLNIAISVHSFNFFKFVVICRVAC